MSVVEASHSGLSLQWEAFLLVFLRVILPINTIDTIAHSLSRQQTGPQAALQIGRQSTRFPGALSGQQDHSLLMHVTLLTPKCDHISSLVGPERVPWPLLRCLCPSLCPNAHREDPPSVSHLRVKTAPTHPSFSISPSSFSHGYQLYLCFAQCPWSLAIEPVSIMVQTDRGRRPLRGNDSVDDDDWTVYSDAESISSCSTLSYHYFQTPDGGDQPPLL